MGRLLFLRWSTSNSVARRTGARHCRLRPIGIPAHETGTPSEAFSSTTLQRCTLSPDSLPIPCPCCVLDVSCGTCYDAAPMGETLGAFQIEGLVGQGGCALVYKTRLGGRPIALKVPKAQAV